MNAASRSATTRLQRVPGDDDALLAAVEALLDAHSADLASLKQEHEAQAEKRREAGQHLAAELAEAQQQARDAQADVAALRTANDALRARHKLLVREVKKSRSAQAGPPAEDTDEASQEEAPSGTGAACTARAGAGGRRRGSKGVRRAARGLPRRHPEGARPECRADGGRGVRAPGPLGAGRRRRR